MQASFSVYENLSFNCTSCGLCCKWFCYSYGAEVDRIEKKRVREITFKAIQLFQGVSLKELQTKIETQRHLPVKTINKKEHIISCIFLSEQDSKVHNGKLVRKCKIYNNRPFDCRIYPLFWDIHSDGKIMFHVEHCEGITFEERASMRSSRDIFYFLENFFEPVDIKILASKIKNTPKKPRKIPLFSKKMLVGWKRRNDIWKKLIDSISIRSVYVTDLLMQIYEKYQAIRESFDVKESFTLNNISIYEKNRKGNICTHRITSERYYCNKNTLNELLIDATTVRYFTHFMKETMLRERCYATNVKKYDLSMDEEIQMFLSQAEDIFNFLLFAENSRSALNNSTYRNYIESSSELEVYRIGLSRVDPYPDFYLFHMNKLKLKHSC